MATYISLVQFTDKGIQAAKGDDPTGGGLGLQGGVDGSNHQANVLDTWAI
jgi:hypothetical protein